MLKLIFIIICLTFLLKSKAQDIGAVSSSSPVSGCTLSSSEITQVFIFNFGADITAPFDISYTVNGAPPVTETINLGTFFQAHPILIRLLHQQIYPYPELIQFVFILPFPEILTMLMILFVHPLYLMLYP